MELQAQLDVMTDIGWINKNYAIIDNVDNLGAMFTKFMRQLQI